MFCSLFIAASLKASYVLVQIFCSRLYPQSKWLLLSLDSSEVEHQGVLCLWKGEVIVWLMKRDSSLYTEWQINARTCPCPITVYLLPAVFTSSVQSTTCVRV